MLPCSTVHLTPDVRLHDTKLACSCSAKQICSTAGIKLVEVWNTSPMESEGFSHGFSLGWRFLFLGASTFYYHHLQLTRERPIAEEASYLRLNSFSLQKFANEDLHEFIHLWQVARIKKLKVSYGCGVMLLPK